ncbi:hypothetical protein N9B73_01100 [Verrucomicrobiales bacterium]|jgi:hypothetical protein|nr:hypothetical protein [Verrucomicrobiales bacterium]
MEKRNRYRNRIHWLTISRLALGAILLLATGVGFVLVRNQHVIQGDEIRVAEEQIADFDQEIELWELRIAAVRDRQELSRRLRWVQSDLKEVDTKRVIEMAPVSAEDVPVASAY